MAGGRMIYSVSQCRDFSSFRMAAVYRIRFLKLKKLMANTLDRPILHHAAKFRALQKRVVHFNAKFCTNRPYIAAISQFLKYFFL